jgi:hypothetical protein
MAARGIFIAEANLMHEGQLLALTEEIYDAATGATPWSTVGQGLMRLVGAQSASLMAGDFAAGRADLLYHADIPLDAVLAYRTHYRKVDLWTNRAAAIVAKQGMGARPKVWVRDCQGSTAVSERLLGRIV